MSSLFGALLWIFSSLGFYPVDRPQVACMSAERATADSYADASSKEVCHEEPTSLDRGVLSWLSSEDPGDPISNGF